MYDVDQMLRDLSSRQWFEWNEWLDHNPSWYDRMPYYFGKLIATFWDIAWWRIRKRNKESVFTYINMIRFGDAPQILPPAPTRTQSVADQKQTLFDILKSYIKPKPEKEPPHGA